MARMEIQIAQRADRVRREAPDPRGQGQARRGAVLDRRQPPAFLVRREGARRSGARAAALRLSAHAFAGGRAGQSGGDHHRLRERQSGVDQWHAAVAGRAPYRAQRLWQGERHRPGRSRREPFRRHEVTRYLRDAWRHDPLRRASCDRVSHPRPRGDASQGFTDAVLRRARLLRLLVLAGARDAAGAGRQEPGACRGQSQAQALQRQRHRRWALVAEIALLGQDRDLRGRRRRLRPKGRSRLHQTERASFAPCRQTPLSDGQVMVSGTWRDTPLLDLFGIELPIIAAPMANFAGVDLAVAVAEAGGLGSLPCAALSPDLIRADAAAFRSRSNNPLHLNFFCQVAALPDHAKDRAWLARIAPYFAELGLAPPPLPLPAGHPPFGEADCAAVEDVRPDIVSFHFGLPREPLLARVRATGCKVISSATSLREALWLAERHVDAIIAQGAED